ncbi:MAG TPA: serine/threonine-protein kinase [Kofleriaceae bacterium]
MSDVDLRGTVLEDRYQVGERLAEGAMGSVWRGERVKLGRQVAIKIMHEQLPDELASRERFEREAKLMARLDHPNCVSVIDFGLHGGMPFLVMELVHGTSLQELLDREHRFEPARAVEILKQVLSGLAHAHELGIVHRDIKPSNLMVGEKTGIGLQVRILDFGLARATEGSTKLTTGIVVGTPNYMAPEQCRGTQLDGRCDLYACGVILFEMLAGRKPFVADDPYQVVRKHLNDPPPRLADVAPGDYGDLEAVVARALTKSPDDRFASAQIMSAALDAALAARKSLGHAVPRREIPAAEVATPSGWAVPEEAGLGPRASGLGQRDEDLGPLASGLGQKADPVPDPAPSGQSPRPKAQSPLPLSRKQLTIAGASILGLIILVAVIASLSGSTPAAAPADKPAVAVVPAAAPAADPVAEAVSDVDSLIVSGDRETALEHALRARRDFPDSPQLAVLAGRIYFAKLYWTDGIKQFRDALRLQPALRSDPELLKTALRGFITTPSVDPRIEEFLRLDLGDSVRPYLEETAREHPNPVIRQRAESELRRLR